MGTFNQLFGKKKRLLQEALSKGGTIIDVRTPDEFKAGNVEGSKNIPLDQFYDNINKVNTMQKPIVLCCASGARSSTAKRILKDKGIGDVINGGSWNKVRRIINSMD